MLAAVAKNGLALQWAGEFQGDRAIVLAVVAQTGLAFGYASAAMRADTEVVKAAFENNAEVFQEHEDLF